MADKIPTPAANQSVSKPQEKPQKLRPATSLPAGPSPLQSLRRHSRSPSDPTSVSITFLSGPYNGQKMDVGQWLGAVVSETSHEISATWDETEGLGIRCSSNFKKLGARTFTLSVEFYDPQIDISHLTENLSTLLEVGTDKQEGQESATPPLLSLRQGSLVAKPVFCTQVSPKYSNPHGGDIGFKMATVDMSFTLMGGLSSSHATGAPLVATPLTDWRSRTTVAERSRQASQKAVDNLLAPCLGAKGSDTLKALLASEKLNDVGSLMAVDAATFVQMAIGGLIKKETLADPKIREKLGLDLASVMAQGEDGIGAIDGASPRRFAKSLMTGDASGLTPDLQKQSIVARDDYQLILAGIQSQALGDDSGIFTSTTAGNRFRKFGQCGIDLRKSGAIASSSKVSDDEKTILDKLNTLLADPKTTDKDIKERIGLKSEEQAKTVRNAQPYASKAEFCKPVKGLQNGVEGLANWNRFAASKPSATPPEPAPAAAPT